MQLAQAKNEVLEACKVLVERGLVARTWGNISCRVDENSFVITPSGIGYERLTPDSIVEVEVHTLEHKGGIKPSSEKGIHAAAYRLNRETNFVIHTHQTYATCISVAGFASLAPTAEETKTLGGKITAAKYGLPGTKKLSGNVEQALSQGSAAVLMEKHGALLTGADREMAFQRSVALEEVCRRAAPDIPLAGAAYTAGAAAEQPLYAALRGQYPEFRAILQLSSPVLDAAMEETQKLPALLDDFAQIVGGDVKVCPPLSAPGAIEAAVGAIKGRNAVLVQGLGAVACAAEASDCEAVLSLVEKNALAWLNATKYGKPPALPFVDRKLMRFVYMNKYSKKK